MKTYTLKLKTTGTVDYNLYDGTTLVSDTDLGTLFGSAGEAYFVFDFNSLTPTNTTALNVLDSNSSTVIANTGLTGIAENKNFKGDWSASATAFDNFAALTGVAMDEAQLSKLVGMVKNAGPGKAKVLTTADYNYPTDNPDGVAVWKLEPGIYAINASSTNSVKIYFAKTNDTETYTFPYTFIVENRGYYTQCLRLTSDGVAPYMISACSTVDGTYQENIYHYLLNRKSILDALTSSATNRPLSANQGRVLKGLIDAISKSGAGAPTTSTVGTVGQLYQDTTNGDLYICTDATNPYVWEAVGGGGGGVTELTSADYNYPTDNPTSVALWLLKPGTYSIASGTIYRFNATANSKIAGGNEAIIIGGSESSSTIYRTMAVFYMAGGAKGIVAYTEYSASDPSSATLNVVRDILTGENVVQSTGTSGTNVMSQNAVTSMVFADPSTKGQICIGANSTSSGGISDGGSVAIGRYANALGTRSICITTGANSSNQGWAQAIESIAIGNDAVTGNSQSQFNGNGSIAIGTYAEAGGNASVALGAGAKATQKGEMNIGDNRQFPAGYNNSKYRLLTGLYDPQSAHDAATKGYVDPSTDSSAPTTATAGRLGEIRIDTGTDTAYMCVKADTITPEYTWKQITA